MLVLEGSGVAQSPYFKDQKRYFGHYFQAYSTVNHDCRASSYDYSGNASQAAVVALPAAGSQKQYTVEAAAAASSAAAAAVVVVSVYVRMQFSWG